MQPSVTDVWIDLKIGLVLLLMSDVTVSIIKKIYLGYLQFKAKTGK